MTSEELAAFIRQSFTEKPTVERTLTLIRLAEAVLDHNAPLLSEGLVFGELCMRWATHANTASQLLGLAVAELEVARDAREEALAGQGLKVRFEKGGNHECN